MSVNDLVLNFDASSDIVRKTIEVMKNFRGYLSKLKVLRHQHNFVETFEFFQIMEAIEKKTLGKFKISSKEIFATEQVLRSDIQCKVYSTHLVNEKVI